MIETILSWILTAVGEGLEAMMDYLNGLCSCVGEANPADPP